MTLALAACSVDVPLLDERYNWSCACEPAGEAWSSCATAAEIYEEATAAADQAEAATGARPECLCKQRWVCEL